jgi:hypothetical protein
MLSSPWQSEDIIVHEIGAQTTSPKWDLNPRPKVYETFANNNKEEELLSSRVQIASRACSNPNLNTLSFRDWLASQGKTSVTIKQAKNYAIKYGHVLDTGDASTLVVLTPCNRRHAMTALASLAKFQGRYDRWLHIRQCYNLKWSSGNNSLQALQRFFDTNLTLESMLSKVKEMMRALPATMAAIIRFAVLTGLRPSEACESVRLLNTPYGDFQYYNPDQQCLEHFRFPDIFLRQTKKAYLSYLSSDNYQWIASFGSRTPYLERHKTGM